MAYCLTLLAEVVSRIWTVDLYGPTVWKRFGSHRSTIMLDDQIPA